MLKWLKSLFSTKCQYVKNCPYFDKKSFECNCNYGEECGERKVKDHIYCVPKLLDKEYKRLVRLEKKERDDKKVSNHLR